MTHIPAGSKAARQLAPRKQRSAAPTASGDADTQAWNKQVDARNRERQQRKLDRETDLLRAKLSPRDSAEVGKFAEYLKDINKLTTDELYAKYGEAYLGKRNGS